MKLKLERKTKDAFQKACIQNRYTCQFHNDESNDEIVIAYVRDEQLGELTPALAFWLGCWFTADLFKELEKV
jgi:hypothetical protein